jgi:hypothetical protein
MKFYARQVVWAKIEGYPNWPALVKSERRDDN